MTTDAIEAGARATEPAVTGEMKRIRALFAVTMDDKEDLISYAKEIVRLRAAIASGALVPASAVAAERERCAAIAERFGPQACTPNGRIMAEQIEKAIRALPPAPASGEFVVVPREPTDHMVRCGEDGGRKAVGVELSQEGGRKFADAAYRAMLNAATKDGERGC